MNLFEILGVVGSNSDSACGDKAAEEMLEICVGQKASFVVTLFRPGVGEINVKTIDGIIRDEVDYKVHGIGADDSHVFQLPPADAVNGVAIVFACPFDAEEIDVRLGLGLVKEEGSLAGADFDLDGVFASENLREVDFALQIFGSQGDRRVVL